MYRLSKAKKYDTLKLCGVESRDFEKSPYTDDELRVVDYLEEICPDIGAGDDPILFLISSHFSLRSMVSDLRCQLKNIEIGE